MRLSISDKIVAAEDIEIVAGVKTDSEKEINTEPGFVIDKITETIAASENIRNFEWTRL